MKRYILLLLTATFLLNSCYAYRAIEAKKGETLPPIQQQLTPNQIFKIDVDQKTYKIIPVKWEGDSLVAKTSLRKDATKKFATKQITNVRKRQFSETNSNTLTAICYITLGAGIYLLLK